MSAHLVASYFGPDASWVRLARVLEHSAAQHCPTWDRQVVSLEPRAFARGMHVGQSHVANTQKMAHWCEAVAALPDGARVLLIDADTLIVRPLDDVWELPFDLAYTTKASTRIPFNTGVVFVRVSPVVRGFLQAWLDRQIAMLRSDLEAREWRRLMIGLNQSALAAELERAGVDPRRDEPPVVTAEIEGVPLPAAWRRLQFRRLPCVEWNCEDESWARFDPAVTRIVHVKSALRDAVFGRRPMLNLRPLVTLWKSVAMDALAEQWTTAPHGQDG